jgi:SAM-dependent methyltransferase
MQKQNKIKLSTITEFKQMSYTHSESSSSHLQDINCPYCCKDEYSIWASENSYNAVKCAHCGFIYVTPRPSEATINEAVETGLHSGLGGHSFIGSRSPRKVNAFRVRLARSHADVWSSGAPISWLDVGAGYGEVVQAVQLLAPRGSRVTGLEPMKPKADAARAMGLDITNGYLKDVTLKYNYISLINVFSHVPDFRSFLLEIKSKFEPLGEIFLITGNTADLKSRSDVPAALRLPDHLTFAGKSHLVGFLNEAGFDVISTDEIQRDTWEAFARNCVKKVLNRTSNVMIPGTSPYRDLVIRARLRADAGAVNPMGKHQIGATRRMAD